MTAELRTGSLDALGQIVFAGYKGWHDQIAERQTLSLLTDLKAGDGYDRELVLAYARMSKSETAIEQLEKILNKFEAKA